jgi:hypothetical protein
MPLKRSRFGIKYFAIVDCETKFIVKIIVYLGRSGKSEVPVVREYSFGGSTDIELLKPFFEKNHKVIVNN